MPTLLHLKIVPIWGVEKAYPTEGRNIQCNVNCFCVFITNRNNDLYLKIYRNLSIFVAYFGLSCLNHIGSGLWLYSSFFSCPWHSIPSISSWYYWIKYYLWKQRDIQPPIILAHCGITVAHHIKQMTSASSFSSKQNNKSEASFLRLYVWYPYTV